eukprot:jgi/Chlat1/7271/Chrsp58S06876
MGSGVAAVTVAVTVKAWASPSSPSWSRRRGRRASDHGRVGGCLRRLQQRHQHAVQQILATASAAGAGQDSAAASPTPNMFEPFLQNALSQLKSRLDLQPYPYKESYGLLRATDKKGDNAEARGDAFQTDKLRFIRPALITAGTDFQVFNFVIMARPSFDLPIFGADFVCLPRGNVIALDFQPLHQSPSYLTKYAERLLPLAEKYRQFLPDGGALPAEATQFFSPAVLWSRAMERSAILEHLYPAFVQYLQASHDLVYLDYVDSAEATTDSRAEEANRDAQHKYLTYRAVKDPGRGVLTRYFGAELTEAYIQEFLFSGVDTLSTKTFLDHFPEFATGDGQISRQRSMQPPTRRP